jgi:hypothetical protein
MGHSHSIESLANKQKKFDAWLDERQSSLNAKTKKLEAEQNSKALDFYNENKYSDFKLLANGSNTQFENMSSFSTANLMKIINSISKEIFSGGPSTDGADVNAENGKDALSAAESLGQGSVDAANLELFIAGKVFGIVSSIVGSLDSSGSTSYHDQYKTKSLGYGMQLFVTTVSSTYHNKQFFTSDTIVEIMYIYEVRFSLSQAKEIGKMSMVKQYEDELSTFHQRQNELLNLVASGKLGAEAYSAQNAVWQKLIDDSYNKLKELDSGSEKSRSLALFATPNNFSHIHKEAATIHKNSNMIKTFEKRLVSMVNELIDGSMHAETYKRESKGFESLIENTHEKIQGTGALSTYFGQNHPTVLALVAIGKVMSMEARTTETRKIFNELAQIHPHHDLSTSDIRRIVSKMGTKLLEMENRLSGMGNEKGREMQLTRSKSKHLKAIASSMRGTFYRSDTRHPINDAAIFRAGFTKRNAQFQDPVLRYPAGRDKSPDIIPSSAVCFTRDFKAAPLFPVSDLETDSWVYILDLDVANNNVYNTQQVQWEYVTNHQLLHGKVFDEASEVLWTMFGQERAANQVAAQDIVGAVRVTRNFNRNDVFNGGTFVVHEYLSNPNYAGSDQLEEQVASVMHDFHNEMHDMPDITSGFKPSTKR